MENTKIPQNINENKYSNLSYELLFEIQYQQKKLSNIISKKEYLNTFSEEEIIEQENKYKKVEKKKEYEEEPKEFESEEEFEETEINLSSSQSNYILYFCIFLIFYL
jgi:hypothetical protein